MDMRKIIFSVMTLIFSLTGSAQSYDERIADAMNRSDWFALDQFIMKPRRIPYHLFSTYFHAA